MTHSPCAIHPHKPPTIDGMPLLPCSSSDQLQPTSRTNFNSANSKLYPRPIVILSEGSRGFMREPQSKDLRFPSRAQPASPGPFDDIPGQSTVHTKWQTKESNREPKSAPPLKRSRNRTAWNTHIAWEVGTSGAAKSSRPLPVNPPRLSHPAAAPS